MSALRSAAFMQYRPSNLPAPLASALYGDYLSNSVSRLELFASCCYAHFVRYGLKLNERTEYEFEASDLGNVFHSVLEQFSAALVQRGLDWNTFTSEEGEEILNQVLEAVTAEYGDNILTSSSRGLYAVERIRRILSRTVESLQYQLRQGSFTPDQVEMDFSTAGNIDEINIALTKDEKGRIIQRMKLNGRIDRMDLAADDEKNIYVKVIDFKSGNKSLDLASVYYGLQLQLVLYMNVARAVEQKLHPDNNVEPAAILYYHVTDPMLSGDGNDISPEELTMRIRKELRTTGVIMADDRIIGMLDRKMADNASESDVIPVKLKKDGSFAASSKVMGKEDFGRVSAYVDRKIREYGKRILAGDIQVDPYEMKNRNACTYCTFRSICRFDASIPGYRHRDLELLKQDDVLLRLKEDSGKNEH
jgi:ATP-dependent helicase/nuclease subunit B